jgi:hypothetical protein
VAFELRTSLEGVRHEHDAEVAAFARAGVAGVFGAVVKDLERTWRQLAFQRETKLLNSG